MDMRTDLIAVPHASLRDPNPEKPGEGKPEFLVVKGHEVPNEQRRA